MAHPAQKHHDTDRKIGAEVRKLRRQLGLTQEGLAERLGITFQQVQKYEKGSNRIAVSTLIAISAAFGMSPSAIINEVVGEEPTMADALRSRVVERFEEVERRNRAIRGILDGTIPIDHLDLAAAPRARRSNSDATATVQ